MKKIFAMIAIAFLFFPMLSAHASLTWQPGSGCVGYWNFDESSGTVAHDSSGNGNYGTLQNTPIWVDGRYGEALSFDGSSTYVQIPDSSSLDVTANVTVEAWVYPRAYVDSAGHNSAIVSRTDTMGGHIYVLSIYPNNHKVSYSVNPSPDEAASTANLTLNAWTFLAMTYNSSYVSLYINGTFDSGYAQSGAIETTTNWLAIGCAPTGPYGGAGTYAYFNGTIDDVILYNKALTQKEIANDMNHGLQSILLAPSTGFASTTVVGSGFSSNSTVTITWDGETIPSIPSTVIADATGNLTAMISVPTQTTPGIHTVSATDENGDSATATFTVVNMTGPQGPAGLQGQQGTKGDTGDTGPQGPASSLGDTQLVLTAFPTAASILALCIAVVALLRKKS